MNQRTITRAILQLAAGQLAEHGHQFGINLQVEMTDDPHVTEDGMVKQPDALDLFAFKTYNKDDVKTGQYPDNLYGNEQRPRRTQMHTHPKGEKIAEAAAKNVEQPTYGLATLTKFVPQAMAEVILRAIGGAVRTGCKISLHNGGELFVNSEFPVNVGHKANDELVVADLIEMGPSFMIDGESAENVLHMALDEIALPNAIEQLRFSAAMAIEMLPEDSYLKYTDEGGRSYDVPKRHFGVLSSLANEARHQERDRVQPVRAYGEADIGYGGEVKPSYTDPEKVERFLDRTGGISRKHIQRTATHFPMRAIVAGNMTHDEALALCDTLLAQPRYRPVAIGTPGLDVFPDMIQACLALAHTTGFAVEIHDNTAFAITKHKVEIRRQMRIANGSYASEQYLVRDFIVLKDRRLVDQKTGSLFSNYRDVPVSFVPVDPVRESALANVDSINSEMFKAPINEGYLGNPVSGDMTEEIADILARSKVVVSGYNGNAAVAFPAELVNALKLAKETGKMVSLLDDGELRITERDVAHMENPFLRTHDLVMMGSENGNISLKYLTYANTFVRFTGVDTLADMAKGLEQAKFLQRLGDEIKQPSYRADLGTLEHLVNDDIVPGGFRKMLAIAFAMGRVMFVPTGCHPEITDFSVETRKDFLRNVGALHKYSRQMHFVLDFMKLQDEKAQLELAKLGGAIVTFEPVRLDKVASDAIKAYNETSKELKLVGRDAFWYNSTFGREHVLASAGLVAKLVPHLATNVPGPIPFVLNLALVMAERSGYMVEFTAPDTWQVIDEPVRQGSFKVYGNHQRSFLVVGDLVRYHHSIAKSLQLISGEGGPGFSRYHIDLFLHQRVEFVPKAQISAGFPRSEAAQPVQNDNHIAMGRDPQHFSKLAQAGQLMGTGETRTMADADPKNYKYDSVNYLGANLNLLGDPSAIPTITDAILKAKNTGYVVHIEGPNTFYTSLGPVVHTGGLKDRSEGQEYVGDFVIFLRNDVTATWFKSDKQVEDLNDVRVLFLRNLGEPAASESKSFETTGIDDFNHVEFKHSLFEHSSVQRTLTQALLMAKNTRHTVEVTGPDKYNLTNFMLTPLTSILRGEGKEYVGDYVVFYFKNGETPWFDTATVMELLSSEVTFAKLTPSEERRKMFEKGPEGIAIASGERLIQTGMEADVYKKPMSAEDEAFKRPMSSELGRFMGEAIAGRKDMKYHLSTNYQETFLGKMLANAAAGCVGTGLTGDSNEEEDSNVDGALSRLFGMYMLAMKLGISDLRQKVDEYIDKDQEISRVAYMARSNIMKELTRERMTFKAFAKGLKILGANGFDLQVNGEHLVDGKVEKYEATTMVDVSVPVTPNPYEGGVGPMGRSYVEDSRSYSAGIRDVAQGFMSPPGFNSLTQATRDYDDMRRACLMVMGSLSKPIDDATGMWGKMFPLILAELKMDGAMLKDKIRQRLAREVMDVEVLNRLVDVLFVEAHNPQMLYFVFATLCSIVGFQGGNVVYMGVHINDAGFDDMISAPVEVTMFPKPADEINARADFFKACGAVVIDWPEGVSEYMRNHVTNALLVAKEKNHVVMLRNDGFIRITRYFLAGKTEYQVLDLLAFIHPGDTSRGDFGDATMWDKVLKAKVRFHLTDEEKAATAKAINEQGQVLSNDGEFTLREVEMPEKPVVENTEAGDVVGAEVVADPTDGAIQQMPLAFFRSTGKRAGGFVAEDAPRRSPQTVELHNVPEHIHAQIPQAVYEAISVARAEGNVVAIVSEHRAVITGTPIESNLGRRKTRRNVGDYVSFEGFVEGAMESTLNDSALRDQILGTRVVFQK